MKKILLSAMMVITCFSTVYAQQPQRDRRATITPEKMVQRMDRALDLSEKQEKKLTELYSDYLEELKDMKEEGKKMSREERKEHRLKFNKKVNEVLTSEQQQKWEDIKKSQAEKRRAKTRQK